MLYFKEHIVFSYVAKSTHWIESRFKNKLMKNVETVVNSKSRINIQLVLFIRRISMINI